MESYKILNKLDSCFQFPFANVSIACMPILLSSFLDKYVGTYVQIFKATPYPFGKIACSLVSNITLIYLFYELPIFKNYKPGTLTLINNFSPILPIGFAASIKHLVHKLIVFKLH